MIFTNSLSRRLMSSSDVGTMIQSSIDSISSRLGGLVSMFWSYQGRAQSYLDYALTEIDPMLSQKRLAAAVVSIERETFETVTIILKPSSRWKGFSAGQYITLEVEIGGVRYRRNYSLSCSPKYFEETGKISITVKAVSGGRVSNFLNRYVRIADLVHISDASGEFVLPGATDERVKKRFVFVAGGSGVTPIRSMIDDLLETAPMGADAKAAEVLLIHYGKNADDIIFQNHFESLAKQYHQFTYIKHFSDTEGNISAAQMALDCQCFDGKSLYMCGPEGFMAAVRKAAGSLSVVDDDIYCESFGGGASSFVEIAETEEGVVNFSFADRQVKSTGKQSLLELAEAAGLAPKFGCRNGICHECKCQRPEGRLFNRLTGDPISEDQSHIQSCVAVPSGNLTLKEW